MYDTAADLYNFVKMCMHAYMKPDAGRASERKQTRMNNLRQSARMAPLIFMIPFTLVQIIHSRLATIVRSARIRLNVRKKR